MRSARGGDIYSLGVVLYRMLCGTLPFVATDKEKLYRQIIEVQPEPPSRIDADGPQCPRADLPACDGEGSGGTL